LAGFTVGITADRRGEDQAVMFRRLGAEVVLGPTMATVHVPEDAALRTQTEAVIADPPDYLIANTGLGIRTWMSQAEQWGLVGSLKEALGRVSIAARGPKASGALSIAGLEVWWRAPGEQLHEVIDHLITEGVQGRRIALQLHGDGGSPFVERLEAAGAKVVPITVYRWTAPADAAPGLRLIDMCCDGQIDAITFTAGPQVRNMIEMADGKGRAAELITALNDSMTVGCIGPVCAAVAEEEGLTNLVVPENWRLGSLVRLVTETLTKAGEPS
jgi:uroporphyrinogen-III synthase